MKITLLGTGTSTGVPQMGCTCAVCTSKDPHDSRLRCSALVETDSTRLLIDCGPDFRQQLLDMPFKPLDAVLLTHEHYDHVGGLDDLRPYSVFGKVPIYADELTGAALKERLPYCFAQHQYPGVPQIDLRIVAPHEAFSVGDLSVLPIRVMHGQLPILGFRIGNVGYITDMKTLPSTELPLLQNLDVLIMNALRQEPHPTHQTVAEACAFAQQLHAPRTYLIHMSHHAGLHAEVNATLPAGIQLGFDGEEINV